MNNDEWTEQRSDSWRNLSPGNQERLTKSIRLLAETHGRKLSDQAVTVWCKALAPYVTTLALFRALAESCEDERMPSIAKVKSRLRGRPELEECKPIPEMTPEERERSDKGAVLSMLWLHHIKGWPMSSFAGTIFERRFGRDPTDALHVAAQTYDRTLVEAWMGDQKLAGH